MPMPVNAAFRQYGGIVIALIVLCAFFSFASPHFLRVHNLMNILQ